MKFSNIFLVLVGLFAFSFNSNVSASSDGCSTYFPITVGMQWTLKSTDKKGKETGRNTMKVLDALPAEGGLTYKIQASYEMKGEDEVYESNFEYNCVNNVLKVNMDQFLPAEIQDMEGVSFDIDSDGMKIPATLTAGEQLPDASVKVTVNMNGAKLMEMNMVVTDRMVEKIESITTEAGTYSCAKITSNNNMKMGFMDQTTSSIQWISNDVGFVKTEEYDKKGKLASGSELVEFSR